MRTTTMLVAGLLAAASAAGCGGSGGESADSASGEETARDATTERNRTSDRRSEPAGAGYAFARASLTDAEGREVGEISFRESDGSVQIQARVHGIEPGAHGLHVHENADCAGATFTSAGGHFNPEEAPHGAPEAPAHHAGDFGNILVADDGIGELRLESDAITVTEGDHSVVGRAIILHADADDLTSQPSGAAGARIACGIVELETEGTEESAGVLDAPTDDALRY